MEKATDTPVIPEQLTPPDESNISMILNGAGNGMMLGAAPFLLAEMAEGITKKSTNRFEMSPKMHMAGAIVTVVGAILGGIYGRYESKELNKYRLSIGKELSTLNAETKGLKDEIRKLKEDRPQGWAARAEAEQSPSATDIAR